MDRRNFFITNAGLAAAVGGRTTSASDSLIAEPAHSATSSAIKGQVESVISIWLGGGMGQIDTFDPKRRGDPKAGKAGSYYDSIETAVPDVRLCAPLSGLAPLMDRITAVRTIHHGVIDEHAAATNRMHTGRPVTGTVVYPSLGSVIANQRGPINPDAPAYVLIGYPNVTRGPGFLGPSSGYLYLTDTSRGPNGLSLPLGIDHERQSRRERYLNKTRETAGEQYPSDKERSGYMDAQLQMLRLIGPSFNRVFQLENEDSSLRNKYGSEFGQRCLLARRLVESGVRFIEVSHNLNFINGTGWDVHNEGILKQHELIQDLDQAMATLIVDLESRKMLDKTLIVITTEFGRPAQFDGGGGRGHQGNAFSCVLAGGGLRHCGEIGVTDDVSKQVVADPVSVPDFFATIHATLGIDPHKYLYHGDRPVPITDNGTPIKRLLV